MPENMNETSSQTTHKIEIMEDETFIDKIKFLFQNIFMGKGDSKYERIKKLREIKKDLKSINPSIYKINKDLVTPEFAEKLFELYRYCHPLKLVLNLENDKLLKSKVEDYFVEIQLSKEQKEILQLFETDNFVEVLNKSGVKELDFYINEMFQKFQKTLQKDQTSQINNVYTSLFELSNLVEYDYYPILKKFGPALQENVISNPPKFRDVDGRHVLEELKDISELIYSMNLKGDFVKAILLFGKFKGIQLLPEKEIKNFIQIIKDFIQQNIFQLLIEIITKDAFFRPIQNIRTINLVQNYLKNLSVKIKTRREQVVKDIRETKVKKMILELFGIEEIPPIENYSYTMNDTFREIQCERYLFSQAMSFIKYFIMERYNRYIRDLLNKIIIDIEMTNKDLKKSFSDSYHIINELMKDIMTFNESIADSTQRGAKVKTLIRKAAHEQSSKKVLNEYIDIINHEAYEIINKTLVHSQIIADVLKMLYEDYKDNRQRNIQNARLIGGGENREIIKYTISSYNDITKLLVLVKSVKPAFQEKIEEQNQ